MTRKYELLLVLPGTLDDKETEAKLNDVEKIVKEYGAEVEVNTLGKNRLAYPIRQIRYGYFYTMVFNSEPTAVKTLEAKLRLLREPLRAMVSLFNTTLTAAQKIVYSTDDAGVTTMKERAPTPQTIVADKVGATVEEKPLSPMPPAAAPASAVGRKVEELDMESITKKLDDIMKGDVIPGV